MSFGSPTNTTFLGLATTTAIFAGIGGTCLIGFETMRQLKRLPHVHFRSLRIDFSRLRRGHKASTEAHDSSRDSGDLEQKQKLNCEDWEMGHLYHARTFHATTPTPPLAKWPLQWAWQAVKFDDWFYATHTGMDTVIYVRFLKACVWWTLLHTFTTAPTLLAIHFHYSEQFVDNGTIDASNMARASLSYVAASPSVECASADKETRRTKCIFSPNPNGQGILWVHLLLLYYMTFTWWYFLWRLAHGGLKIRWRLIQRIRETEAKKEQEQPQGQPQQPQITQEHIDARGWRQRTLMVSNMPVTMRDEAGIRRYFEEYLRPDDASTIADDQSMLHEAAASNDDEATRRPFHERGSSGDGSQDQHQAGLHRSESRRTTDHVVSPVKTMVDGDSGHKYDSMSKAAPEPRGPEPDLQPDRHLRSPIQAVVLVRKMNELSSLLARRQAVLGQLEAAHVKLASSVLADVRARLASRKHKAPPVENTSLRDRLNSIKKRTKRRARAQDSSDVEARDGFQLSERNLRLEELVKYLGPFVQSHDKKMQDARDAGETFDDSKMDETVWEALAEIPRELLDPYQPVTRLSALFRGQTVPTIDYLLTKLNLLTALVTEMRARPPSSYAPASTAFVTFRDPRQARMVWRELKDQIVVKVRLAPEVKDLDWERLMNTTFSGEVVRGASVSVFVWGATLFWTILISLLTSALANFTNIGALKPFFLDHQKLTGFVNTTLPALIVALITMSVPELVFQISKRAQGFVTFSQLYDMCLTRYWKFVILNVVVFFAVGAPALQTLFFAKTTGTDVPQSSANILSTIGFSFPISAPYFVSYLILGMGLHSGFELLGFMVPLVQHYGARRASTPRDRAIKTLPRNFNRYYWLPFHVLIVTILFIFTLLNPLVAPFGLVYLLFALVVFKKNLAFVYYRRFNEMEGVVYFVRILRFSLDGLIVGQAVLLILFSVLKLRAVYIGFCALTIPLTVIFKLLATRWWRSQCRALDEEEACALCGLETLRSAAEAGHAVDRSYGIDFSYRGSLDAFVPLDARATGRYPPIILPLETSSVFYNTWQKIHDSFHANGYDRPSHIAQMGAKGEKLENPAIAGAKALAHAPATAARISAHAARQRAGMAKATFGIGKGHEQREIEATIEAAAQKALDASTTAPDIRITSDPTDEERVFLARSKTHRSRVASFRSEEAAPFLSSFDVLNSHAPVPTQDNEEDGASSHLRVHSTPRRSRSNRSTPKKQGSRRDLPPLDISMGGTDYSPSVVPVSPAKSGKGVEGQRDPDVSEFGAMVDAKTDKSPASPRRDRSEAAEAGSDDENEDGEHQDEDDSDWDDDEDDLPLVRRHAPVTWDDTPNNSAKYNNPFYSHHLDPFLWLPRDPTKTLNLFDTIEWYGPALVSSQGGAGNVGEWEEDEEECDEKGTISELGAMDHVIISGHEEIVLSDTLARHLEEAEEIEETQDIAASVPKAVLNDYRDAIRQNSRSETDAGSSTGMTDSRLRLERQESYQSGVSSIRSPTRTIRQRAEMQGATASSPPHMAVSGSSRSKARTFSAATSELPDLSLERSVEMGDGTSSGAGAGPMLQITDATLTGEPDETIQTIMSPQSRTSGNDVLSSPQRGGESGGGLAAPSMAPAPTSQSIAFAGTTKAHDHEQRTQQQATMHRLGMHPRRSAAASNMSHATTAASAISSGGGPSRPVTLQQALRAEILEEEWRTTLKERLITLKRSKMVSKLSGSSTGKGRGGKRRSSKTGGGAEGADAGGGGLAGVGEHGEMRVYGDVGSAGGSGPIARPGTGGAVAAALQEGDIVTATVLDASTSGIMARHALRRQMARSEGGEHTVEELLQSARLGGGHVGTSSIVGVHGGGGHKRGFSLGRSRSRAARREASTSAALVAGLASATALPASATWNPLSRGTQGGGGGGSGPASAGTAPGAGAAAGTLSGGGAGGGSRRAAENSVSMSAIEHVPMREFGVRPSTGAAPAPGPSGAAAGRTRASPKTQRSADP
ncbi:hypothetical protein OC834_001357 [Tilletia horrida]|nr:hypothetical protein OC834_001357 [Tilletia horrida]